MKGSWIMQEIDKIMQERDKIMQERGKTAERITLLAGLSGVLFGVGSCLEQNITGPIEPVFIAMSGVTAVLLNQKMLEALPKKSPDAFFISLVGIHGGLAVGIISGLLSGDLVMATGVGGFLGGIGGHYIGKYIDRQKVNDF